MASPIKYFTKWTHRPPVHREGFTGEVITLQNASFTPRQLIERHALDPVQVLNKSSVEYDIEAVYDSKGRIVPDKDIDIDHSYFPDPSHDIFDNRAHALDLNELYQYDAKDLQSNPAPSAHGEDSPSVSQPDVPAGDV